jgi:hypothetical protein
MEKHMFDGLTYDSIHRCWGFFGDEDKTVDCKQEFQRHIPFVSMFHGGHRMNNKILDEDILPFVKTRLR